MSTSITPRLQLRNITKRYAATIANDSVSLEVMPGEIVALLGENGAGKSTLMKVAYGVTRPDAGAIAVDGAIVDIDSPQRARALGIAMVFQQFVLFDSLTVLQNIALGLQPAPMADIESRIVELAKRYELPIDSQRLVHELSVGERQRVEILRALMSGPRVLILDEPTSVLTPQAVHRLFETLRQLAVDGVSIIFISHKLHEVRSLATRCVVMRAGSVVAEVDPRIETEASLARMMFGADPPLIAAHDSAPGEIALKADHLTVSESHEYDRLDHASLEVRSGEIVGIAGISGNGQQTLMAALAGELLVKTDTVRLFGREVGALKTAQRRMLGLRYVPERRLGHAAVAGMTLVENVLLTDASVQLSGALNTTDARNAANQIVKRFDVRAASTEQRVETLSGGNLQKFIVGREIQSAPRVLLVDQPTWGVDAGSAASIHNELIALREAGCAIVIVSEDLDELFRLCDRLVVMSRGRISPARAPRDISTAQLGPWMAGSWAQGDRHDAELVA